MTLFQSANEVDDEAADWATRADGRGLDQTHDVELQAWLRGDPRREGAFLRAQAALSLLNRGRALAGLENLSESPRLITTRRALIASAGGAGLAASAAGVAFWATRPTRFGTQLGEIRRVPLQDGSLVAINTTTVLDAAISARSRQINLRHGEAWFEVAKDATRPFEVIAGRARVRALGTAFSVHRRDGADGVDVMVTEGVIEAWMDGMAEPRHRLVAGNKILLATTATTVVAEASAEIERNLAWRDGEISLDGETLGDAVLQFNRYNRRKIVIEDSDLARERFIGLFRTNEPERFAAAVAAMTGAKVSEDDGAIRLSREHLS